MPDGSSFHADRRTGLGGSDIGAILGLNPWRTPYQVWLEKTGREEPFQGNLQTRFGAHAEEFVAQEYCHRTSARVQRFNSLLRHPSAPLIGHIDRLVIPEGAKIASWRQEIRTDKGLEAKTAHALAASRGDDWGEAGSDAVPAHYLLQAQAYMALTHCPHWDLAVLFGNSDFQIYHLHRDQELEGYLIEEASRWWRDYVEADTPPPPSSELEARQRWPGHVAGKVLEVDERTMEALHDLARVKASIRAMEKEEQVIRDALMPILADCETATWKGQSLCTFKANKASEKIHWQGVYEEIIDRYDIDPADIHEALALYTRTIPGPRVLRLSKALEAIQ